MQPTTLTDLPPELLDHIANYLPTARSVSDLGRTNKSLLTFVEKDAWQTFVRTQFPSLNPVNAGSHKDVARTFTTLSKAWDRRAFVARYIEPHGNILAFPGGRRLERWKRPRGQTIGFTPQLDCFEEIGSSWRQRKEVLAFSAGAEICVRERKLGGDGGENVRWKTYRPLSASEGRDDVTTLHLVRPHGGDGEAKGGREMVFGTANGDLQLLDLLSDAGSDVSKTYFATQGLPVRSSSLWQEKSTLPLLAANLGDNRVSLYTVDPAQPKIASSSSLDIRPPQDGHRAYRAWSVNFLSSSNIAVGLGPSDEPIHIYSLTPSGLDKERVRKFSLQNDLDKLEGEITLSGFSKKTTSSVYPIVPLPPFSTTAAGSGDGQVFLSGAYDGIIRLHDLRSDREVEQAYIDPTDDSAIYSLLPRGQETLVAGTSRHSLLKVFDLRLGAKPYSYLEASTPSQPHQNTGYERFIARREREAKRVKDWNLFLKPHNATYPGRGGGNNWARRSAESSVYSLASPSLHSPYLYAGVENAVVEMAFTSVLDEHPDPVFFSGNSKSSHRPGSKAMRNYSDSDNNPFLSVGGVGGIKTKEVLDLAMYDQTADMKLMTQRSLWTTVRSRELLPEMNAKSLVALTGLDERWKVGT